MSSPITADSTLWTADSTCWTADGRIICIDAEIFEPLHLTPTPDAVTADSTRYTADSTAWTADGLAVGGVITGASDSLDAEVPAAVVGYVLTGFDAAFSIAPEAAVGYVITGFDAAFVVAPATTTGYVLTGFDALFVVEPVTEVEVGGGGAWYYPPRRPFPVIGRGYGILPRLWGEAHGVVGAVGKSAAQLHVRAAAIGACGQAGAGTVVLKGLSVVGKGAVGARGSGHGVIMKFSGSATGRHDDDEAAVIAILLAA